MVSKKLRKVWAGLLLRTILHAHGIDLVFLQSAPRQFARSLCRRPQAEAR